jgi:hypothetical protein
MVLSTYIDCGSFQLDSTTLHNCHPYLHDKMSCLIHPEGGSCTVHRYVGTSSTCGMVKPSNLKLHKLNTHLNSGCNSFFPVSIHGIHSLYSVPLIVFVLMWKGMEGYAQWVWDTCESVCHTVKRLYILINVSVMFLTLFVDSGNKDVCNYTRTAH